MKKNILSYSSILLIIATSLVTSSFAQSNKDKPGKINKQSATPQQIKANQQETNQFIQQLMSDKMVDQVKGFVVEKKQNLLYINGQQQTSEIANKYLPTIKQDAIRVQVFSLQDRINMHPGSSLIQVLTPVTFSSPCVDYGPKGKDGC